MKLTLKRKLILAIVSVIVLFGSLATIAVFNYSKKLIFDLQNENLKNLSIHNSNVIEQTFKNVLYTSKVISSDKAIVDYLNNGDILVPENNISEHLETYKINDSFDVLYIMDKNGLTVASTEASFLNNNYGFREYFQEALKGSQTVEAYLGVTSKQLGYYFASPIFGPNNNILGAAVIKTKPKILDDIAHILSYKDNSEIMVLDNFGVIVYADKEDRLFKSIGPLSSDDLQIIKETRKYEGIKIEGLQYNEVQSYLKTNDRVNVLHLYDNIHQTEEILSISRVGGWPFFLVIEEQVGDYLFLANRVATILSLIVLITAIFSVLIIFAFINSLIKPINMLKKTATKLSKGDLSARANIKTGDEIEDLARAFDSMASKMEKNIKDIEKKVSKRTEKLQELNSHMIGRELKMVELKNKLKNKK